MSYCVRETKQVLVISYSLLVKDYIPRMICRITNNELPEYEGLRGWSMTIQ